MNIAKRWQNLFIMKKLLFLCSICLSFFATEAQTGNKHKKTTKKNKIDAEARVQAKLDSLEAQRQVRIDSMVIGQLHADSVRKINDSIAYQKQQEERMAWNQLKTKETDSLNKEHGKELSIQHKKSVAIQNERNTINKAARLNDYQGQQVNFINQAFYAKAQKIKLDSSIAEDQKKQQLAKLNEERRSRLQTVIGKSKEKKFEKARKSHNNSNDTEVQWINEVEGLAKN